MCTKIGPLRWLLYTKRLEELCLTTLEVRRIRGDLISMFRYFKGFDKINFLNPPKLSSSRQQEDIYLNWKKNLLPIIQEESFFLVGLQMNGIHFLKMLLILIL